MNPMTNKTAAERKASALKGVETRKRNRDAMIAARQEASVYRDGLREEIRRMESKLQGLRAMDAMATVSATLTGKSLLSEVQIVNASQPWESCVGVYFLIFQDSVVYVGQSVSVHSRINSHLDKTFNRYAYIPCQRDELDLLESMYIHILSPKHNGNHPYTGKCAPLTLTEIMSMAKQAGKLWNGSE